MTIAYTNESSPVGIANANKARHTMDFDSVILLTSRVLNSCEAISSSALQFICSFVNLAPFMKLRLHKLIAVVCSRSDQAFGLLKSVLDANSKHARTVSRPVDKLVQLTVSPAKNKAATSRAF